MMSNFLFPALFVFSFTYAFTQNVICVDVNNTGTQNGSSSKPFANIAAAIDLALSGDTIKVAEGTYSPVSIIEKKVHLLGGYLGGSSANYASNIAGNFSDRNLVDHNTTILAANTESCIYLSIEQQEIPGNASISGFLLTGGVRGITIFGEYSGFVSNITIEDNEFTNCGTENTGQLGGGIGFEGINITIRRNKFTENKAGRGAAISRTAGSPENFLISDNYISNNHGYDDHAGAVYLNGTGVFSNNIVANNDAANGFNYGWGGGIMLFNYDTTKLMIVANNVFHHNIAPSRGGAIFVDEAAKVLLNHNLIYANTNLNAEGGAAIYVDSDFDNNPSVVEIRNCTIAGNTPGLAEGGALYVQASIVKVENCIFWENSADDFHLSPDGQSAANLEVNYTLSKENFPGTGNSNSDPLFVDFGAYDFHVKSHFGHFDETTQQFTSGDAEHSPAIDAGNPLSDFSQEPQMNGNRINLGVYGNTAEASKSGTNAVMESNENLSLEIFPNPCSDFLYLKNATPNVKPELYNEQGQKVNLKVIHFNLLSIENLSSGTYFLKVNSQIHPIIIE